MAAADPTAPTARPASVPCCAVDIMGNDDGRSICSRRDRVRVDSVLKAKAQDSNNFVHNGPLVRRAHGIETRADQISKFRVILFSPTSLIGVSLHDFPGAGYATSHLSL